MPSDESELVIDPSEPEVAETVPAGRSRWKLALLGLLVLFVAIALAAWLSREQIVGNLISSELEKRGIPATYRIESIGTKEQVLSNLVIGDPNKPDFTAERVIVAIRPRFGVPDIGGVRLVRPRLYGTYLNGKLSFGTLDPLIFTGSKEPFRLPDMNVAIEDGRGLIESEYGAAGIALSGKGNLRSGFAGQLAANAPDIGAGGCTADRMTLFGKLSVSREKPRFEGPVRLTGLACGQSGIRLAKASLGAALTADPAIDGAEGSLALQATGIGAGEYRLTGLGGNSRFTWRGGRLTARYDLAGKSLETPQLRAPNLKLAGRLRASDGFASVDLESDLSGSISAPGAPLIAAMDDLARSGSGTLLADVAAKARDALRREARGARLSATITARHRPAGDSVIVPVAVLRGGSGAALASLSRLQLRGGPGGTQVLGGSFMTDGPGLPRLSGTVRQGAGGRLALEVSMAEYAAGTSRVELPRLVIAQAPGSFGFSGRARLSGPLPGGEAKGLALPIEGNWSQRAGLSVWRSCTNVSFERLRLASLDLSRRALALCPPRGSAIVRTGPGGLKIAAGLPALDLAGRLGETPIRIASGPVGLAWPGNLAARTLDITLGPAATASRFRISQLAAKLGDEVAGRFDGADVTLDAVPLDLRDMAGRWRYAQGVLSLSQGSLRVEDREPVDRFEPLVAHDAQLKLVDNIITAQALLREPQSDREVLRTEIRHDLATGRGHADLIVDGLQFDDGLQPDTLTHLALGVIANAQGSVRGTGRIDWNENAVTSTGRFSTDNLDFAAAFGPVTGAKGTIEFTDLLGLVTAPDQTLSIAAINPGIEVNDGVIVYELRPGQVLSLKRARWPFLGGTLRMRPVDIPVGSDQPVRYVLVIDGIDAALFVQQLDLGNLAATGTFDGRLPLIFDENGGRIDRGRLESRPPGGNVSYVGELTYKDLSAMANFAFDALRSIDYKQMQIRLDGPLAGEIITRVTFDGISQGEGASSNFVTRRIAKLPIRFRINVRAPFMQLVSSMRSLYDPEYIRDPQALGILEGGGAEPGAKPAAPQPGVQTPESDKKP